MLWVGAPRWLYVPVYVALGWVAVVYLPAFAHAGGAAVLALVVAGGLLYTLGGLVYGIAAQPEPALVRLPRGVPRPDGARLRRRTPWRVSLTARTRT